jgi:hypothetical protein
VNWLVLLLVKLIFFPPLQRDLSLNEITSEVKSSRIKAGYEFGSAREISYQVLDKAPEPSGLAIRISSVQDQ